METCLVQSELRPVQRAQSAPGVGSGQGQAAGPAPTWTGFGGCIEMGSGSTYTAGPTPGPRLAVGGRTPAPGSSSGRGASSWRGQGRDLVTILTVPGDVQVVPLRVLVVSSSPTLTRGPAGHQARLCHDLLTVSQTGLDCIVVRPASCDLQLVFRTPHSHITWRGSFLLLLNFRLQHLYNFIMNS